MERYVGLDAHATSSTFAVISESGKRLSSSVVETNGRALVQFIKTVPGRTHLCMEEGAQSGWLYEVLSPHVDERVVTHLDSSSRGRKDDATDAFARAEELRVGSVKPVFKDGGRMGQLRAHVDVQAQVTADVVRVQNRLKALYRSRGVSTVGGGLYTQSQRSTYLEQLPKPYQSAALLLYAQFDMEPLYSDYVRLTQHGTKPPMAKLTLAHKVAATALAMWKNQEAYDPSKHRTQS